MFTIVSLFFANGASQIEFRFKQVNAKVFSCSDIVDHLITKKGKWDLYSTSSWASNSSLDEGKKKKKVKHIFLDMISSSSKLSTSWSSPHYSFFFSLGGWSTMFCFLFPWQGLLWKEQLTLTNRTMNTTNNNHENHL